MRVDGKDGHYRVNDVTDLGMHLQYDPFEVYETELGRPTPVVVLEPEVVHEPQASTPAGSPRAIHLFRKSHSMYSHMYCGVKVSNTGSDDDLGLRYTEAEHLTTCPPCLTAFQHEPYGE